MKRSFTQIKPNVDVNDIEKLVLLDKVTILSRDTVGSPLIVDSFFISVDSTKWVRKIYRNHEKKARVIYTKKSSLIDLIKLYGDRKHCNFCKVYGIKNMRVYPQFVSYSTFVKDGTYLVQVLPNRDLSCGNWTFGLAFKCKDEGRVDWEFTFEYYDKRDGKWHETYSQFDQEYIRWVNEQGDYDVYFELLDELYKVYTVEDAIKFIKDFVPYDSIMLQVDW